MIPFYKSFVSLITGVFATKVSTLNIAFLGIPLATWLAGGSAAASIYGGYKSGQAAKEGGEAARDASYANAADLREFSGINADLLLGAAGRNAQAQMTIGEANAGAIERAVTRNLMLYGLQAGEEVRRHKYGERMSAGRIRAMVGAAGVQTNTGTPLAFLYSQVDEGIRQRKFMETKHAQTMWTMAEEGKDRAGVTRLTASENAAVIMSNAEAQAAVSVLDAERQASSMERSGDIGALTGAAQGSAAMISGFANALGSIGAAYSSFNTSPTSLANNWNSPNFGWQNQSSLINPFPASTSSAPPLSTGFTTGGSAGFNSSAWGNAAIPSTFG